MKDSELNKLDDMDKRVFKALQKSSYNTLSEAIKYVAKELNLSEDDVSKTVYILWKKGYIDIIDEDTPKNFLNYIFHIEGTWFHIVTTLIIITLILVYIAYFPPLIYFRYVLGSLFVLYLPGYALIEALYPRGDELEPLERLALSIGLSLALVPLVGLVLNYTPWGIRLTPIVTSLAILTETLVIYSLYRKYQYFRLVSSI